MDLCKNITVLLACVVVVLMYIMAQHRCGAIVVREKVDTLYMQIDTTFESTQVNKIIGKPLIKWRHDTLRLTDTLFEFIPDDGYTFEAVDTIRHDGQFVALVDSGDCFGIKRRIATWGGHDKVITKTITQQVANRVPFLSLYATMQASVKDSALTGITPGAMLLFGQRAGVGYGYNLATHTHQVGVQIKIK